MDSDCPYETLCNDCGTILYVGEGPLCGNCAAEREAEEQLAFEREMQRERDLEQAQEVLDEMLEAD